MKNLNLLILDDDVTNIEQYKIDIDLFNSTNEFYNFNAISHNNLTDALSSLKSSDINYAIVDLRLDNDSGIPSSGNELLCEIQQSSKIPAVVISGFLNDFDSDNIQQSYFLKCISRDKADIYSILNDFCTFEKCGLSEVFKVGGKLDSLINSIFWNNISNSIDPNDITTLITPEIILRYIGNSIKESLSYDLDGSDIDYHPLEFYFIPPIHKKISTGSIIEYDGNNYVNLTPACDLANNKATNYQLVKIDSFESITEITECLNKHPLEKKSKVEKGLRKILSNNSSLKYHFLPPHKSFNGGVINFQTVVSFNAKDISENGTLIGSITPDFIKDISARFGMYYSRQGQPNLTNLEYIYNQLYDNR